MVSLYCFCVFIVFMFSFFAVFYRYCIDVRLSHLNRYYLLIYLLTYDTKNLQNLKT